jgi:hypothetical protein
MSAAGEATDSLARTSRAYGPGASVHGAPGAAGGNPGVMGGLSTPGHAAVEAGDVRIVLGRDGGMTYQARATWRARVVLVLVLMSFEGF